MDKDKEYWKRREFIEFCFKKENKIKTAIYEKRNDPNRATACGHGSGISKPTEIEAINRAMPLLSVIVEGRTVPFPEKWVNVIALTKAKFNYRQGGKLYYLRYIKNYLRAETIKKLEISKTRYHQLIIEIIDYTLSITEDKMYEKESD